MLCSLSKTNNAGKCLPLPFLFAESEQVSVQTNRAQQTIIHEFIGFLDNQSVAKNQVLGVFEQTGPVFLVHRFIVRLFRHELDRDGK